MRCKKYLPSGIDPKVRDWLTQRIYFHSGSFDEPATFGPLKDLLRKIDEERKTGGNYLFYMATAPEFFGTITQQLKDSELTTESEGHWRRAVLRKNLLDTIWHLRRR